MKKIYSTPILNTMLVEQATMLCLSTSNDPADSTPAGARGQFPIIDDFDEDDSNE